MNERRARASDLARKRVVSKGARGFNPIPEWLIDLMLEFEHKEARRLTPYGEMCCDPDLCRGKGYCPRDPTCGD